MGYIKSATDGANSFLSFISGEKIVTLSPECNFEKIATALGKNSTKKYSIAFSGELIKIKKKSILFSPSHYVVLSQDGNRVVYSIKMNTVERFFVRLFASVMLLGSLAGLGLLMINLFVSGAEIDAPAIIVLVSAGLVVWLKFICIILAFLSGVSKPYRLLSKLVA